MCFNSTVSLLTYIIGMTGSYKLYTLNFLPESIFYAWVTQMQLLEYILWSLQPCNVKPIVTDKNIQATKIATVVNHLEPFVLWFAILYFSNIKLQDNINQYMYIYAFLTVLYTYNVLNTTECTTVTKESDPHLHWKWNGGPYYVQFYTLFLITLLLLAYNGLPYPRNIFNSIIILISYLISYFIYYDKHSVGAMWCFAAAFAPWLLTILYNYKIA